MSKAQPDMSDDVIERLHSNWSADLPHGVAEWHHTSVDVKNLTVIQNRDSSDIDGMDLVLPPRKGIFGLVASPHEAVDKYVEEHGKGTISIPQYYTDFPEHGETVVDRGGDGLRSEWVEAAIRMLNDGGRYDESEFTLYDCLQGDATPCPLVRDGVGCILISPALSEHPDS